MKKTFYFLCVALLILSCTQEPEAEQVGSIYGVITDKATGEPIKSAGVQLNTGAKTVTGSEGQYEFANLTPGDYKVSVTKTGYADFVDYRIVVGAGKTAKGDVQIEKLPPSLRIVNDNRQDISELDFGAAEADITRSFNLFNDGENKLEWEITNTSNWIVGISKASGQLVAGATQSIVITINRDKLSGGENTTTIHITSDNGSKQLTIKASGKGHPQVSTQNVTEINSTSAILNGIIEHVGEPAYTERGFVYGLTQQPTIMENAGKQTAAVNSNAVFSVNVVGLMSYTTYYVRAYAVNSQGISYGNDVSFTTASVPAEITTSAVTNVNASSATLNASINNAGSPVYAERGFCYSKTNNPTTANNKMIVAGSGVGEFSHNASGLEYQTTYYVRAYVIQNGVTIYGNEVSFNTVWQTPTLSTSAVTNVGSSSATFNASISNAGNPIYTERGFCYGITNQPTIANNKKVVTGTGEGNYSLDITGLEYETTYYVRAYVIHNGEPIYGNVVNFTTIWIATTLNTSAVTSITATAAIFNGTISNAGNPAYTERGFVYSTTGVPTINDSKTITNGVGISGNFSKSITDLSSGKTYYVRAYAIQSGVAIYGSVVNFTTIDMPVVQTNSVSNLIPVSSSGIILSWNVTFNGSIISSGTPAYTERGFVYDVYDNPTVSNNRKVVSGNGTGAFSTNVVGLQNYKTYYVRAYAKTSTGTYVYGQSTSFQTYDW